MTVEEILRQTGLSDDQIKALDAKVVSGFTTILSTASQAETQAKAAQADAAEKLRLQQQLYENDIVPALNTWGIEKTGYESREAFYKKQLEGARASGFIPSDAPGFQASAARDPGNGQYVPGANAVPGSPGFTAAQGLEAISNATWFIQEHQRLYGAPPPDDFMTLMNESVADRRQFKEYVDRKYKFADKRAEITATKQKEHDDKIAADAIAANDKKWAERVGNNPMVRQGGPSQYDKISAAQKSGQLKDPLLLSPEQRRQQTTQAIQADITAKGNA